MGNESGKERRCGMMMSKKWALIREVDMAQGE